MKTGWLCITLLVYMQSFFLAFFVCGFVDQKSVSGLIYTVIKVKSWSLVTVVLAACCWFLVLFDSSRMLRSLCLFCSLTVFSLGGFPKLFPSGIGLFVHFTFCKQKCTWLFYQYSVLATDASVVTLAATLLLHENVYSVFWLSLEL